MLLHYPSEEHGTATLTALCRLDRLPHIKVLKAPQETETSLTQASHTGSLEGSNGLFETSQGWSSGASKSVDTESTDGTPADTSLKYCLQRLHISFQTCGAQLRSLEHGGYHVATSSDLKSSDITKCIPPFLDNFLVLVPDSDSAKVKVLVPDGRVSWDTKAQRVVITPHTSHFAAKLKHHVFSLHPHTRHLGAPTKEARIFLALLYAAGDCGAALPGLGKTGGQTAIELLRQCAGCTPLSAAEEYNLVRLSAHAAHTPALQLLCASLHTSSTSLEFLWVDKPPPAQHPMLWREGEESFYLTCRDYVDRGDSRLPIGNMRDSLTPYERRLLLGQPHEFRNGPPVLLPRRQPWSASKEAATAASTVLLDCQEAMAIWAHTLGISQEASPQKSAFNLFSCLSCTAESKIPFNSALLRQSRMGQELLEDLDESFKAHDIVSQKELVPVKDSGTLEYIARSILELLPCVRKAKSELEVAIIKGVEAVPNTARGASLRALRAAGLVGRPVAQDLLTLPLDCGRVLERLLSQLCFDIFWNVSL
jgi:hypothetical protein